MGTPLTILTWFWHGWRPVYNAERVNTFCRMMRANLTLPHRIVCITDIPEGITEADEVRELWPDDPRLRLPIASSPMRGRINCYRRLRIFDERFVRDELNTKYLWQMDLDCIVTGNLDHLARGLLDGDYTFRMREGKAAIYNGSMIQLRAGTHQRLWDDFDPARSPTLLQAVKHPITGRRMVGSDQAWISAQLGEGQPTFGPADGVYAYDRYGDHFHPKAGKAVLWFFAGGVKPWDYTTRRMTPELWAEYRKHDRTPDRKKARRAQQGNQTEEPTVQAVPDRTLRAP